MAPTSGTGFDPKAVGAFDTMSAPDIGRRS